MKPAPKAEVFNGLSRIQVIGEDEEEYPGSWNDMKKHEGDGYESACFSVTTETPTSDWMLTAAVLICNGLGFLMALMTVPCFWVKALTKINYLGFMYVATMVTLQAFIPDFHGTPSKLVTGIFALLTLLAGEAYTYAQQSVYGGIKVMAASRALLPDHQRAVWIDSGCSKSVFVNKDKLINLRKPDMRYTVSGMGGSSVQALLQGDFPVSLREKNGSTHVIYIRNCLYAPDSMANLLATEDLAKAGIGFEVQPGSGKGVLTRVNSQGEKFTFPLHRSHNLHRIPFYMDTMVHVCGMTSHHFRSLTEAELWHLRLGHASSEKIAKLSKNCIGIKKPLAENEFPCHHCHEGKAQRSRAPPASDE